MQPKLPKCWATPGVRRPSEDAPGRIVVIGTTPNGRELFVVVVGDNDPVLVVTVAERRPAPRR